MSSELEQTQDSDDGEKLQNVGVLHILKTVLINLCDLIFRVELQIVLGPSSTTRILVYKGFG